MQGLTDSSSQMPPDCLTSMSESVHELEVRESRQSESAPASFPSTVKETTSEKITIVSCETKTETPNKPRWKLPRKKKTSGKNGPEQPQPQPEARTQSESQQEERHPVEPPSFGNYTAVETHNDGQDHSNRTRVGTILIIVAIFVGGICIGYLWNQHHVGSILYRYWAVAKSSPAKKTGTVAKPAPAQTPQATGQSQKQAAADALAAQIQTGTVHQGKGHENAFFAGIMAMDDLSAAESVCGTAPNTTPQDFRTWAKHCSGVIAYKAGLTHVGRFEEQEMRIRKANAISDVLTIGSNGELQIVVYRVADGAQLQTIGLGPHSHNRMSDGRVNVQSFEYLSPS